MGKIQGSALVFTADSSTKIKAAIEALEKFAIPEMKVLSSLNLFDKRAYSEYK